MFISQLNFFLFQIKKYIYNYYELSRLVLAFVKIKRIKREQM